MLLAQPHLKKKNNWKEKLYIQGPTTVVELIQDIKSQKKGTKIRFLGSKCSIHSRSRQLTHISSYYQPYFQPTSHHQQQLQHTISCYSSQSSLPAAMICDKCITKSNKSQETVVSHAY